MSNPPAAAPPLTLGAQIDARALDAAHAERVFLCQHERSWTFRRYRDECLRYAHFLLAARSAERRPAAATWRCCSRITWSCWPSTGAAATRD